MMAVSHSDGDITLWEFGGSAGFALAHTWHAHEHEAWICAFHYWNTSTIFTGLP